jgi:hypothetical protein
VLIYGVSVVLMAHAVAPQSVSLCRVVNLLRPHLDGPHTPTYPYGSHISHIALQSVSLVGAQIHCARIRMAHTRLLAGGHHVTPAQIVGDDAELG